jgi:hypothetical protein
MSTTSDHPGLFFGALTYLVLTMAQPRPQPAIPVVYPPAPPIPTVYPAKPKAPTP